jgi:hypothetical protein
MTPLKEISCKDLRRKEFVGFVLGALNLWILCMLFNCSFNVETMYRWMAE